jgi:hypothetical protein
MKNEKDMAAAKELEHIGSGIMMGGGKNLMDQAFAGLDGGSAGVKMGSSLNNSINAMVQGGQIQANDMRLADYYMAQFELAETYKKQPEILAAKLTEAYDKIFAKESEEQKKALKKQKQDELSAFSREKSSIYATLEYLQIAEIGFKRKLSDEEREKQRQLFSAMGQTNRDAIWGYTHKTSTEIKQAIIDGLESRYRFAEDKLNKDPLRGTGEYLKRTPGMIYPGEPGYGKVDFKSGTIGGMQNLNMFGPGGGFGASGGKTDVPTGGAAPKPVANNYIVDTNSMVTAVNTSSTTTNSHLSKIVEADGVLTTETIKLNTQLTLLNKNQANGYTELLRRTDITNSLLDTLIGATADASAKPIQINGKRINDVMQSVKSRQYGIGV